MAGYTGTPLPKKLGVRSGQRIALLDAPEGFETALGPWPEAVTVRRDLGGAALDLVLLFVTQRSALERRLSSVRQHMAPAASFWVAWPKKASGVATDVTENVVREVALPTGLVDNKVCAIDQTWSGLRLVIRLEHRH